ncbi:MAG: hypothetical protein ABEH78_08365 [Haloferacaceae archaeon]
MIAASAHSRVSNRRFSSRRGVYRGARAAGTADLLSPAPPRRVAARRAPDEDRTATVEDRHLRNYDADRTYEPTLVVTRPDGGVVTRRTYRLPPGQCRSERDLVDPGTYVVRVRLDDSHDARAVCRIGDDVDATALVEPGNGAVAVSAGLPR